MTARTVGASKSTEPIQGVVGAAHDRGLELTGQDGSSDGSRCTEGPEPERGRLARVPVGSDGFHRPRGLGVVEASPGSQSDVRPGRVLLLEDEKALRDVLSEVLTGEGYQVETCRTFGELYRTASELRGYVALADFWGPSLCELTNEDRAEIAQLSRLIPVILMTARGWADEMTAEQLGTRALLHKPFELEELLASIRAASVEA
jgi:CheY-like chemotaxis protein